MVRIQDHCGGTEARVESQEIAAKLMSERPPTLLDIRHAMNRGIAGSQYAPHLKCIRIYMQDMIEPYAARRRKGDLHALLSRLSSD